MRTLSLDLRERIVAAYDGRQGTREEVAQCFGVSVGMVKKLLQRKRTPSPMVPVRGFPGRMTGLTGGPVGWLAQTA
jgi:transposase